jgi:hypothetical protein
MREYPCYGCTVGPGGWVSAKARKDWKGMALFLGARQNFYLGTYAVQPALAVIEDRYNSPLILALNMAAVGLFIWIGLHSANRWLFLLLFSFVSASWAEALLIRPESRFLMLPLTWVWSLALLELLRLRQKRSE